MDDVLIYVHDSHDILKLQIYYLQGKVQKFNNAGELRQFAYEESSQEALIYHSFENVQSWWFSALV